MSYNSQPHLVFLQGKVTAISSTGRWCALSAGLRTSAQDCCDATCSSWCTTTTLVRKNPRSLTTWTRMRHNEAKTYSFSRAFHNHCLIAGAKCFGQSIAGWHSASSWPFASENVRLRCRQRGCTVIWCDWLDTSYCDVCFIWSEFITYVYNDKLSHQFAVVLEGVAFFPALHIYITI